LSTGNNALRVICGLRELVGGQVNARGGKHFPREHDLTPRRKAQRTASRLLVSAFADARLRRA